MAASASSVDNVEHIYVPGLAPGRYDLQVLKNGGAFTSPSENYALAFEFFAMPLSINVSSNATSLTWPIYPAGFVLESTPSLASPVSWSAVNVMPVVTNGQNGVTLSPSNSQFFRLRRP
jgi:hypothetical protein